MSLKREITILKSQARQQIAMLKAQIARKEAALSPDLSHLSDDDLLGHLSAYYRVGITLDLSPTERKELDDVYNLLIEAGITPTDNRPQEFITHAPTI